MVRSGIDVERRDFDALHEHQALAVVEWAGLHRRIRAFSPRHRLVDRIVDVAFDDEKAGEAAGHLIVGGAVRMRVIPVRARGMGLRFAAGAAAGSALHIPDGVFVPGFRHTLVRRERAARLLVGALPDLPVPSRQDARHHVVAERAVGVRSGLDVDPMRVEVGGVRPVWHVD